MSKQMTPVQEIKNTLEKMSSQFQMALPKHIPVEKFVRVAQTAILNNKDLASSDRRSLMSACVKSAECGLLPDGREAALVTFKDRSGTPQATFMPMIGGILKLVRNSGELKSITSQIVYKNDDFRYWTDENGEHLKHETNMFIDRGEAIGTYALAILKDGGVYIEVMTKNQIDSVKNISRGKSGPWSGPFETEMWRKTVVKRLAKRLPLSTDIEIALSADDDLYDLNNTDDIKEKTVSPDTPNKLIDMISDENNEGESIETTSKEVPI